MAHWNGKEMVHFATKPCKTHPKWDVIDCGCCAGIEWGGEEPRECRTCNSTGVIYQHRKSGVTAEYPGGPFT
ncbi:hypothetical protein LCGC14_0377210 [marine sediment metagenome]|uniref:Uncharacterized protein n=1 Tax=marine sediment metagenome TaxID=412755 RepID=A0A0F9T3M5_9ZZZZ